MEDFTCDICRRDITYPICFQLNPCSHKACVKCFHEFVPARIFNRCPCSNCSQWVSSSTLLEVRRKELNPDSSNTPKGNQNTTAERDGTRDNNSSNTNNTRKPKSKPVGNQIREVQEVPHFQPDEQMDPFRHWAIKKPKLYTGFIYVAYRFSEDEATFYKSNFKAVDSDVFMDNNSTDEMVKIFARILHPLLFRRDFSSNLAEGQQQHSNDRETHQPLFLCGDQRHQQDRQHLAMRCMYALSSGCVLTQKEQEEKFGERKIAKHGDVTAGLATKKLAKELMLAYKKACHSKDTTKATIPSSPPPPIIHDLRPDRELLEDRTIEASKKLVQKLNIYQNQRIRKNASSDDGRLWANELGLNEICDDDLVASSKNDNDDEDTSSIVPAILWILSAVFILSK